LQVHRKPQKEYGFKDGALPYDTGDREISLIRSISLLIIMLRNSLVVLLAAAAAEGKFQCAISIDQLILIY
jgi:hypothetical protein